MRYNYARREYEGDFGFDSLEHGFTLDYTRSLSRTLGMTTSYRYSDEQLLDEDSAGSITQQAVEVGINYRKPLSPTRSISFSVGAGTNQVETISPAGRGSVSIDIGRSWAVQANYRRSVSVPFGIARQPFATDAALLSLGGLVGRRFELVFSGRYSRGQGEDDDVPGQFEQYSGSAQLRYAVAECCGVVVIYSRDAHRLRRVEDVPEGFPTEFDRNVVRLGVSISLGTTDARRPRRATSGGR